MTDVAKLRTTAGRRLSMGRLLCQRAQNDTSKRLADRLVKAWFSELHVDLCGCNCLDETVVTEVVAVATKESKEG